MLTAENFQNGLLVTDSAVVGVVQRSPVDFICFSTCPTTGETLQFAAFSSLNTALDQAQLWASGGQFETFGCDRGPHCRGAQKGACPSCSRAEPPCPEPGAPQI